jgi:hypothetical protein
VIIVFNIADKEGRLVKLVKHPSFMILLKIERNGAGGISVPIIFINFQTRFLCEV